MGRRSERRVRATPSVPRTTDLLQSRLRLFGVAVICAKVALVPVVFDRDADLPFSVPKALLSHALAYVLAGVIVGLGVQFRRSLYVSSPLHIPVAAFLLANVASTLFSVDLLLALYGNHERNVGLGTIADGVLLYFAIVFLVRTRADAAAVVASACVGAGLVLVYELIQVLGRDPFDWNVDASTRPFSTFGQTTSLAEYLSVVAIGVGGLGLFGEKLSLFARLSLLALSGFAFGGMVMTQTRSGLVGVVLGIAILFVLTWVAHPNPKTRVVSVVGAAAVTGAISIALVVTPLGERVLSTVEFSAAAEAEAGAHLEQSANVRVVLFGTALNMLRERPLLGYGPDNFVVGVPTYRTENMPFELQETPTSSAHGWVAQLAATSGLTGLLTFVAIGVVALWLTFSAGFRPAAWAGIAMLVSFVGTAATTVNHVGTEWLFWLSAGGVAAATGQPIRPTQSEGDLAIRQNRGRARKRPASSRAIAMVCAGLGILLALTAITALDASRSANASRQMRGTGRLLPAIELGIRATTSDPLRAPYWDTLGLAYVGAGRFKDAASAFERASALARYDVRYDGDLARAYIELAQRGDLSATPRAVAAAERAARVDPNNPRANYTRALAMQVAGNLAEAIRSVERAISLDQTNSPAYFLTATQVYRSSGRLPDAVAIARLAIGRINDPRATVSIRIELARALLADGRASDALAEVDAALAISPNDSAALQLRSQIRSGLSTQ